MGSARSALASPDTSPVSLAGVPDRRADRQGDDQRDGQRQERVPEVLEQPSPDTAGARPVRPGRSARSNAPFIGGFTALVHGVASRTAIRMIASKTAASTRQSTMPAMIGV